MKNFRNINEIKGDAELRNMMAEFNVQARDRYHRSIFVRGMEDIVPHDEYYRELKRRTISYDDIKRWLEIK